jgi:uncharacterized protein with NRDE domain
MCITAIAHEVSQDYPLILVFNRDETLDRYKKLRPCLEKNHALER